MWYGSGMVKPFYKVRLELCQAVTTSICSCVGVPCVPCWAVVSVFHHGYLWRFCSKAVSIGLGVSCNLIAILCPVVARWSVSSCLFIIIHIDIVGNRLIAFLLYIGYLDQNKKGVPESAQGLDDRVWQICHRRFCI